MQVEINDNPIIKALSEAWNQYVNQYGYQKNPTDTDDLNDFRKCIHDAQRIVITKEAISNGKA